MKSENNHGGNRQHNGLVKRSIYGIEIKASIVKRSMKISIDAAKYRIGARQRRENASEDEWRRNEESVIEKANNQWQSKREIKIMA